MLVRKILCPVDFSPPSRLAFDAALDIALRRGASLTVLHVLNAVPEGLPEELFETVYLNRRMTQAEETLRQWKEAAAAQGLAEIEALRLDGEAAPRIVEVATDGGHDLVVIGYSGQGGVRRVLLGSVADKVARLAPCAVLVVREGEAEAPAGEAHA